MAVIFLKSFKINLRKTHIKSVEPTHKATSRLFAKRMEV